MTLEDMTILADLMRGRDMSQKALADRLVLLYRDLEITKGQLNRARHAAKRRRPQDQAEAKIRSLENRLESKEKALAFSIQRQEVLRRQLSEALGGHAHRPAYALGGPTT